MSAIVCALLAALVPAAALEWGASIWWPCSSFLLFYALVHAGAAIKNSTLGTLFVLTFASLALASNIVLSGSYYVQRTGINHALIDSLNSNIRYALVGFQDLLAVGIGYFLATLLLALYAKRKLKAGIQLKKSKRILLTFLIALLVFTPVVQLLVFAWTEALARNRVETSVHLPPPQIETMHSEIAPTPEQTPYKEYRSVVIIFLEGLEQAYLDHPGLMPGLAGRKENMLVFDNIRQGVGGTIGGLMATFCGWPPFADITFYEDEEFFPGFRCLGDILKEAGFKSTFMGGADLMFTRKDKFFGDHGFETVLGKRELLPRLPDPEYINEKWGIHDDSLFDLAREKIYEIDRQNERFALVLLTISTHTPGFPAPSCPEYSGSSDLILQAVHCTDHLVTRFINDIRQMEGADEILIAVASDHLMWGGVSNQGLTVAPEDRRMMFIIDIPGVPGQVSQVEGTELDFGPTLATLLGLKEGERLGLGSSLMLGPGILFAPQSGFENWHQIEQFIRSDFVKNTVESARSE